jgi:hypothetical protein
MWTVDEQSTKNKKRRRKWKSNEFVVKKVVWKHNTSERVGNRESSEIKNFIQGSKWIITIKVE